MSLVFVPECGLRVQYIFMLNFLAARTLSLVHLWGDTVCSFSSVYVVCICVCVCVCVGVRLCEFGVILFLKCLLPSFFSKLSSNQDFEIS